jgi:8-oxo-dGTP pyrophosphatase MutT (NUDIX family)
MSTERIDDDIVPSDQQGRAGRDAAPELPEVLLPVRDAARVVLVDATGRTLLFRYENPDDGVYWAPPGGGLQPREAPVTAARREFAEEVGHDLEGPLLTLREWTHVFTYRGVRVVQREVVFGRRTTITDVADTVTAAHTADGILAWRWWSRDELAATADALWPPDLPDLVRRVGEP